MTMEAPTTYKDLLEIARQYLIKDIRERPEEWKDPDYFEHALEVACGKVVPEEANFAWALPILLEAPEILTHDNSDSRDDLISTVFLSIEETVGDAMRKEFGEIAERLLPEGWDDPNRSDDHEDDDEDDRTPGGYGR